MGSKAFRSMAVMAAVLLFSSGVWANLVSNGDFSDLNDPFTAWTIGSGASNYYGPGVLWGEDPRGAVLGTVGAPLFLSQDVATVTGASYVFSFDVLGWDASADPEYAIHYFRADIGGLTVLNDALPNAVWQTVSQTFVATDAVTHIVFESQNDFGYYHLDAVSLVDAPAGMPEPGSLALAFPGLALLLGRYRRAGRSSHQD